MQTTRSLGSTLDRMLTLNRAIDHAVAGGWLSESRVWIPAIDLVERKDAFVLCADLPGVRQADIEIVFEQNVLTVRGMKHSATDSTASSEARIFTAERPSGAFERGIRLPDSIDRAHIVAEFADGVLTVTIPKAQAAQPRRIEISDPSKVTSELRATTAHN